MRLMQAEQFIFHSRKFCKFSLIFLPLADIENALPASISKTLSVSLKRHTTYDKKRRKNEFT